MDVSTHHRFWISDFENNQIKFMHMVYGKWLTKIACRGLNWSCTNEYQI